MSALENNELDWGDLVTASFEGAMAEATLKAFTNNAKNKSNGNDDVEDSTDSKSVLWGGFRLSPDWTTSLWVFLFTTVLYGGFVALHLVRILEGSSCARGTNSSDQNNSNSTTQFSTTTTTTSTSTSTTAQVTTQSPSNNDRCHEEDSGLPLAQHKVALAVVSICVTGLAYLWTMSNMFLAVFTDPGILPRRHEVVASRQSRLLSPSHAKNPAAASSDRDNNNNNSNSRSSTKRIDKHKNESRSSTASSIVFASNRNPALARGSIRSSTVRAPGDVLSNEDDDEGEDEDEGTDEDAAAIVDAVHPSLLRPDQRDQQQQQQKQQPSPPPDSEYVTINDIDIPTPYCSTCHLRRPVRASHCVFCQNCVRGFDHHCGVIGCCVGHFNLRYFTGFVWGVGVLSWLVLISAALIAASERYDEANKKFVLSVCYCAVCFILGVQLGCNLGCHYFCLFRKGFTHREWVKRDLLYGGRGYVDENSPFKAKSMWRQCGYMWCPLPGDADLKAWAEGHDDQILGRNQQQQQKITTSTQQTNLVSGSSPVSPPRPPPFPTKAAEASRMNSVTSPLLVKSGNDHPTSPTIIDRQSQYNRCHFNDKSICTNRKNDFNDVSPQSAISLDTVRDPMTSINDINNTGNNDKRISGELSHSGSSDAASRLFPTDVDDHEEEHREGFLRGAVLNGSTAPFARGGKRDEDIFVDYGSTSPSKAASGAFP